MVSTTHLIFVCSILQCGIVISSASKLATDYSAIPLSELVEELRREPFHVRLLHLSYMFLVESYGDHVYHVSKSLSAECSAAIRANTLMFEKLAICSDVHDATFNALVSVAQEMENTKQWEEHPLELFCRKMANKYAGNATLSSAFEKAKKEAAKFNAVSSRPPYYREILKSNSTDLLTFEMIDKLTVPELARMMAVASFATASQLPPSYPVEAHLTHGFSPRRYFFAKSCVAVAKEEKFADSMQSVFLRAMNDTIREIAVDDRQQRRKASIDDRGYWWIPEMMKTFYNYIASDAILKKELENMAAIIGAKDASKEDLDFSKL